MAPIGLPVRTKLFAIRVIRLYDALPKRDAAAVMGRQLLRSGTSVGAHCREAFRPRSDAELLSKLRVAAQELDEAAYWMELLIESELVSRRRVGELLKEASELLAIIVASARTVRRRRR